MPRARAGGKGTRSYALTVRGLIQRPVDGLPNAGARHAAALGAVALVSFAIGIIESRFRIANLSMLYLLAVLATASLYGRGPAITASIAAFLTFDWFFVEPLHTFTVADPQEWFALILFLTTATITGQLAAEQRQRAVESRAREREATLLYESAGLLAEGDLDDGLRSLAGRVRAELALAAVVIEIRDEAGATRIAASVGERDAIAAVAQPGARSVKVLGARGRGSAAWVRVVAPGRAAVRTGYADRVHLVPLGSLDRRLGALVVVRTGRGDLGLAEARLLAVVGAQLTSALERRRLRQLATEREVLQRADQLKTALLSAVSHDLRTPLASIIVSAGSLRQREVEWTVDERDQFARDIEQEARRLSRIVTNLLDLSRIEGGSLRPDCGWYDVGALVDDVVGRLRGAIAGHDVQVQVPEDLPPVLLDYVEIDQVLSNLVENAARHTPPTTAIHIAVELIGDEVRVSVADRGPGIAPAAISDLFVPFYRGPSRRGSAGTGLGLAVARGLVEAHGGRISVANRTNGGAVFTFTLPADPAAVERTPSVLS